MIESVLPGSLGERLGLQPGDELVGVNGQQLRDVIDVRYYAADDELLLQFRREGQHLSRRGQRRHGESLGLEFVRPTFDTDVRRCNNRCEFCFVGQMPHGLRPSLYVRDDDYRHSFLFGTYVTLTNLTEKDWARIGEQRLSPLFVSVHATDPLLRRRLLHNRGAPDVMAQLRRLAEMAIEVHTQLVLVPGLNDGAQLDRSIGDLASLYPAVRSVSVVPVGLTKHHQGGCRLHTLKEARHTVRQVTHWQGRLRRRLGASLAYLADEWYLRLGTDPPPADTYDDLDLVENGVGLVRQFLDEWTALRLGTREGEGSTKPVTLVTGELFAPVLRRVTAPLDNIDVASVRNRFFGETVTVAGLLAAADVVEQLQASPLGDLVVLPAAMFAGPDGQSLDEMRPEGVEDSLGRRVAVAGDPSSLAVHLQSVQPVSGVVS